jgi:transposase InsO family protein
MTEQELLELYEGLSFPSALNFRRAILREGGTITIKEATAFVSTYSQRQVTAPRKAFSGKIVAHAIDSRWAADLISYIAQPARYQGKIYKFVLVVQDIFSRKMWGRALKTATAKEVTAQFVDILKVSERLPLEFNSDRGVEFQSKEFAAMLKKQNQAHQGSRRENDLAKPDRGIATLKN